MKTSSVAPIARWLIVIISIIGCVTFIYTPFGGDDWVYKAAFEGPREYADNWLLLPKWAAGHWLYANGRIFNLILPALLAFNRIILGLISAAMYGLMFYAAVRAVPALHRSNLYSVALIALLIVVLPWWDSMTLLACQVNYIWAAAFILLSYRYILYPTDRSRVKQILIAILCFIAGASHEAASLPLVVCLAFYFARQRNLLTGATRLYSIALLAGMVFVTFCPGIILRAGTPVEPDDSIIPLMLKTIPAVLVLLVIIGMMALTQGGRGRLGVMSRQPVSVLVIAAVVSAVIATASGIVGRSGWFAEIYAILAIFSILSDCRNLSGKGYNIVALLLALLVTCQAVLVAAWQMYLGIEAQRFETIYEKSGRDIVYLDVTPDDSVPASLLGRFRGVPDADDVYLLSTFVKYHRPGAPMPVVLPRDASNEKFTEPVTRLSDGSDVSHRLPEGARIHSTDREAIEFYIFERDGVQWVSQPFDFDGRRLYRNSRRILDPGDR